MANALKSRVKAALCSRDLDPGDMVRVPDGKWDGIDHPVGGTGKWAIYVGRNRQKFLVRPIEDGVPGKPVEVDQAEHLDDVIQEAALKAYYASKGKTKR